MFGGTRKRSVYHDAQATAISGLVKTTGSTDDGVGFLVTVDGLTLYHAGDHARWAVAFLPIATGVACEPRPSIWQGVRFAALLLKPRVLIPMHVQCLDKLDLYERFRAEMNAELGATTVVGAARRGEQFHYEAGRIRRVQ